MTNLLLSILNGKAHSLKSPFIIRSICLIVLNFFPIHYERKLYGKLLYLSDISQQNHDSFSCFYLNRFCFMHVIIIEFVGRIE